MEISVGLVGLLVVYVIYRIAQKFFFTTKPTKTPEITIHVKPSTARGNRPKAVVDNRENDKSARWYGKNQSVRVHGYDISGGLIYSGESLPDKDGYDNDACLINPKLNVVPPATWNNDEEMGYWPHYAHISAKSRGAYLQWLASGRATPKTNIGYVFLFFYGLERRLFVDGRSAGIPASERAEIVNEVNRLLKIYSDNRSFRGYAYNFLAMEWVLFRNEQPTPTYLDFNDRYAAEAFQVVLAKYVAAEKPIPGDVALQWLILHPELGLRTPARRCAAEFRSLFMHRYQQQFGDGLIVKPNKTPLTVEYRAASPSLRGGFKITLPNLPNPFVLAAPIKKLSALAEACTVELEPYSRFLARKNNDPHSLAAMALLPKDLLGQAQGASNIQQQLAQICADGLKLTSIATIYALLGEKVPVQLSKKEAESFAALVEGVGFGIAPDARFHSIKPNPNDQVVIFPHGHDDTFQPSKTFRTLCTILRLGAIVSQIDQELAAAEEMRLQSLIQENRELTAIEQRSLLAFLYWSLRTPQSITGLKQKLAEVSSAERSAISHILISVAFADGRIDPIEVKQLGKLYVTLGLDKEQVTSDIHALAVASEPVTVGVRDPETNFAIPKPPKVDSITTGFRLNEELVRIRTEETRQVKSVLEDIFADSVEGQSDPELITDEQDLDPLAKLDPTHRDFFNRLIEQPQWTRTAVHEMCHELNLMVDGAMEVLNEWTFNYKNAPLLDDGDPIYVDVDLAREMISA